MWSRIQCELSVEWYWLCAGLSGGTTPHSSFCISDKTGCSFYLVAHVRSFHRDGWLSIHWLQSLLTYAPEWGTERPGQVEWWEDVCSDLLFWTDLLWPLQRFQDVCSVIITEYIERWANSAQKGKDCATLCYWQLPESLGKQQDPRWMSTTAGLRRHRRMTHDGGATMRALSVALCFRLVSSWVVWKPFTNLWSTVASNLVTVVSDLMQPE